MNYGTFWKTWLTKRPDDRNDKAGASNGKLCFGIFKFDNSLAEISWLTKVKKRCNICYRKATRLSQKLREDAS